MARHRYRVTQQLPWIDGGSPGPNFTWIGGKPVVYEPGTMISVDDREMTSTVHCLEATDDAGRAVLERARAAFDVLSGPGSLIDLIGARPAKKD